MSGGSGACPCGEVGKIFGPGLYVHVPFCERRCYYCNFNTYLLREGGVEDYLLSLEREAALYGHQLGEAFPGGILFRTVYVGGGTPTALTPSQLERLLCALFQHLNVAADAEITVEANPGTLSRAKLDALRRGGVNRISLGAQAAQDYHLEGLGRIHRFRHVCESVERARAAGFENINLDLMFGLPGQTPEEWEATLEAALALGPEHLSCYSLIIEEGTPFGERYTRGTLPLPGEDAEAAMFEAAMTVLESAGYVHYEVSNFARPGRECRHNLIYWANGEWLGLGPGAHSQWGGFRFANVLLPAEYARLLGEGRRPIAWEEPIAREVAMEDTLILGLRLRDGVDVEAFRIRFGVCPRSVFAEPLGRARAEGLVIDDGVRLRLTRRGLMVANRVFVDIVGSAAASAR